MTPSVLAPREVFAQILEYMPIATFDVILYKPDYSVLMLKRTIAPYQNVWALPGLRMLKGETIDDTLRRVVHHEAGLVIDPSHKRFIGQYVGRFTTEHHRQDISTCYAIPVPADCDARMNREHFSGQRWVRTVPKPSGAMYRTYLQAFWKS